MPDDDFHSIISFVLITLVEGTLVLRKLQQKFYSVNFFDLPFFMTVLNFAKLAIDARG